MLVVVIVGIKTLTKENEIMISPNAPLTLATQPKLLATYFSIHIFLSI